MGRYDRTSEERFWEKVDTSGGPEACWPWMAYCNQDGYGMIKVNGMAVTTHRLAWTIQFGDVPDGLHVLHKCDNPPCVNGQHLFLGTNVDNMADKTKKGRCSRVRFPGEKHPMAKLTAHSVVKIRELQGAGMTQQQIADVYNVSRPTISMILGGHRCKHLKEVSCISISVASGILLAAPSLGTQRTGRPWRVRGSHLIGGSKRERISTRKFAI